MEIDKDIPTKYLKEFKILISKRWGHSKESALSHLNTAYSNGFIICSNCKSVNPLGKGFTKDVESKCPLCKPKEFEYFMCNPYISEGGLGEAGTGEDRGLKRAFTEEEEYYVSESGLHLRKSKLIKGE